MLVGLLGCSTTIKESRSKNLPKHNVVDLKKGYVVLKNNKIIYFNKAIFTCNTKMVRLESEMIRQTILWINIKKIVIYN